MIDLSILETVDLCYTYGERTPFEVQALKNINLKIENGDFVGIIGHTGSGKSTLIQLFNGLNKPTSGKVLLDGVDIFAEGKNIRDVRFKVGMVFQYPEYQLFEETVYKDIAFGPSNMGLSQEDIDNRVKEAASAVGITEATLQKSPFDLSGGEKRRVAIAGVIAMTPQILVLDEPTAGLDPSGRKKIFSLISDYHKTHKSTIVLVSHTMEEVASVANKIAVMNKSQLMMYDETHKVFSQSEKLKEFGLELPQITNIMDTLRSRGYEVPKGILTVEEATKQLETLISKGVR